MKMSKNNTDGVRLKRVFSVLSQYLLCILGSFMYSAAVSLFVTPLKFAAGGVTGLGILVNHLVPFISTGLFVFIANVPLTITSLAGIVSGTPFHPKKV